MATHLDKFLTASYEEQFALLEDPRVEADVRRWMGNDAFQQFVSQAPDAGHLAAGPKNVIFVPGVMGSTLQSEGLGGVWWLDMIRARDKLNQLKLSDDGTKDLDEDADVKAGAIDISYVAFNKAVATSGAFGGTRHFAYDWRKSLRLSADLLRAKILSVYDEFQQPVHLVGHSMGGLMIRTTLMIHGDALWRKIGRIAFIATPHYGSTSIAGYLKNHLWGWEELAVLAMFLHRETFRSLRGVLSLLPAPLGVYPGTMSEGQHPCANFDLYSADDWKLDLDASSSVKLQNILDEVKDFHTDLHQWHESLLQQKKDRMLMIAGVGFETLFRLEFDTAFWGLWERARKITDRVPCDGDREGDGRVPLASALLEDVETRFVRGEHHPMPNMPAVVQDVLAWLTNGALRLPATCKEALGGHLSAIGEESPTPLLDMPSAADKYRNLPQYENPTPEFRAQIERDLDSGKFTNINLVKLL